MNNDIKEIKRAGQILDYVDTKEHLQELFNYITNLQEEIKSANESVTWWTNRYKAVVRNCDETVKKIMALGEENERLQEIEKNHQKLNGELRKEIEKLKQDVIILEKYLELIYDLGYDYDGLNYEHDLKGLIDEMVRFASLGRACNITEEIYVDGKGKSFNILGEELKGEDND